VLPFSQQIGAEIDMASVHSQVNIAPVRSRNCGERTTKRNQPSKFNQRRSHMPFMHLMPDPVISLLIGTALGIAPGWLAMVLAAGDVRALPARALRLDGSPVADGNRRNALEAYQARRDF
jgi:hypothetical protein